MKSSVFTPKLTARRQRLTESWLSGRITTREFHQRLFTLCRHLVVTTASRKACP